MSAVSEGSRRVAAAEEPQNIIRLQTTLFHADRLKASPAPPIAVTWRRRGLGTDGNHPLHPAPPPLHRHRAEVKRPRTDGGEILDLRSGSSRPRGRSGC